jgi:hypothetical protein
MTEAEASAIIIRIVRSSFPALRREEKTMIYTV